MPHRLLLVLAITGLLWAPRDAAALCEAAGPYLGTGPQLPRGCPLHVYVGPSPAPPMFAPRLFALRSGAYVDVTGSSTSTLVEIEVAETFVNCEGVVGGTQKVFQGYQHLELTPTSDVQVGEEVGFDRGWFTGIKIVAAAPCAAPIVPMPACTDAPFCGREPPFETFEPGGCAAGGAGGLAIGLALLGPLRRARRRRRR